MTISTQTSTITYLGNGSTTLFTFPFVGVNATDLQVLYTNSTGVTIVLSPSQYTLVINAPPVGSLWGIGGSVTYLRFGNPIQVGTFLTINRIVPYTQNVSIANQGAFYPKAVEQGLDLLELQIQQIETNSLYSIRTPLTDPAPPTVLPSAAKRANGYLTFDNFGNPVVATSAPTPSVFTFATPRIITTTGTATVSVLTSDSFGGVSIYQSATPITTVQLPSGYGPYPVFDALLTASTSPITVLPPPGLTILGASSFKITFNGQCAVFFNDGNRILVG